MNPEAREESSTHAVGSDPAGVLLRVAYAGTAYHGWACQAGRATVQATLETAIRAVDPKASPVRGTSRTDAGVHAEAQLAAFDPSLHIGPRGWVLAINQRLPDDVAVRSARTSPRGYNPRFLSVWKRYRYRILLDRVRDPHWQDRAWRIGWPIDSARLKREVRAVVGTHDFAAFRSARDQRSETVRTMHRADVEVHEDPRLVSIAIEGNGFLYNMVRILVGTVMDVARGHLEEGTIARALEHGKRWRVGTTAPAHGLTLEHVELALSPELGESWPP